MEENKIETVEEVVEATPEVTKEVTVALNVDYKTLTNYNLYYLKHIRHFNLIYIVMAVVAFGFAAYNYFASKQLVLSLIMLFFGVYMIYSMFTFGNSIDKQLSTHFAHNRPVKQVQTITNVGFKIHTDGRDDVEYDWGYVSNIHITNDYYYLFIGKSPFIIDRDPSKLLSGTKEDLDDIIEEVAKAKPIKRFNKPITKKPIEFVYPDYDAMEEAKREQEEAIRKEAEERAQLEAEQTTSETVDVDK